MLTATEAFEPQSLSSRPQNASVPTVELPKFSLHTRGMDHRPNQLSAQLAEPVLKNERFPSNFQKALFRTNSAATFAEASDCWANHEVRLGWICFGINSQLEAR